MFFFLNIPQSFLSEILNIFFLKFLMKFSQKFCHGLFLILQGFFFWKFSSGIALETLLERKSCMRGFRNFFKNSFIQNFLNIFFQNFIRKSCKAVFKISPRFPLKILQGFVSFRNENLLRYLQECIHVFIHFILSSYGFLEIFLQ